MRAGLVVLVCGLLGLAGCGAGSGGGSNTTPALKPPVANAGGPYTGTVGMVVSFSGAGSTDPQGEALTYAWNFGDNTTGTGASPSHAYATPGTFTVTLTVSNSSGLTGNGTSEATITALPPALTGLVLSGSQPIVGAHVYLLAANTTAYGGVGIAASSSNASISLLSAAETGTSDAVGAYVLTGSNGGFSLTGDYMCSSGQQLYLYALGGNAGSGTNAAIGLMAALGSCPSGGGPPISATVNEVSTIAAAYAFAGFATDATHVSSSGTALAQVGIKNAFANAANLAALSTGTALATTPAGNGTAPQAEINTLANVLASCVSVASSCSTLLGTATADGTATGTKPTDTATAAINIAHHPGANVASLYGLATANPSFAPGLTSAPNDFAVALSFTGGGLSAPEGLAVDSSGDVWIANTGDNVVTELSSSGAILSGASGYGGGGLANPNYVAIDTAGNAWVTGNGSLNIVEFSDTGSVLSGAYGYSGYNCCGSNSFNGGVSGIAIDQAGNVWVPNYEHNVGISVFSSNGTFVGWSSGASTYFGGGAYGVAIDRLGGVLVPPGIFDYISVFGTPFSPGDGVGVEPGGGLDSPYGIAVDASDNIWITNQGGDASVTKLSDSFTPLSGASGFTGGGLYGPHSIAIDGSGSAWIVNYTSDQAIAIVELSTSGSVLSGASGLLKNGPYYSDAIAVDCSGDVWVTAYGNRVIEMVGVASPVVTPLVVGLDNNMLGTRP